MVHSADVTKHTGDVNDRADALDGFPLVMSAKDLAKVYGWSADWARHLIKSGEFDDVAEVVNGRKYVSRYRLEKRLRGERDEAA